MGRLSKEDISLLKGLQMADIVTYQALTVSDCTFVDKRTLSYEISYHPTSLRQMGMESRSMYVYSPPYNIPTKLTCDAGKYEHLDRSLRILL